MAGDEDTETDPAGSARWTRLLDALDEHGVLRWVMAAALLAGLVAALALIVLDKAGAGVCACELLDAR
jgi:hypothetical protein